MAQSDVFDPIYILSFLHIFKKILEMHNYSHFSIIFHRKLTFILFSIPVLSSRNVMWATYTIYIFLQPQVLKYKEQMTNKKIKKRTDDIKFLFITHFIIIL